MARDPNDNLQERKFLTPEFRVGFPEVFEPKPYQNNPPKFSLQALWPKTTNLGPIKAAVKAELVKNLGADEKKWPKTLKLPFRDGSEKADLAGYENCVFATLSCKADRPPTVIDQKKRPITQESGNFYPGCYARASIIVSYYNQGGGKGVKLTLLGVQKLRDGEAFGGTNDASDDFTEVDGGEDSPVDDFTNDQEPADDSDVDSGDMGY